MSDQSSPNRGHAPSTPNHRSTSESFTPSPARRSTSGSTPSTGKRPTATPSVHSCSRSSMSALFWFSLGVCCTCTLMQQWAMLTHCDLFKGSASTDASELLSLAMIASSITGLSTTTAQTNRDLPRTMPLQPLTAERRALYRYQPPQRRTERSTVDATSECGEAPHYRSYFSQVKRVRRSLSGEDLTIYKTFFRNTTVASEKYHYVELGAFNGATESNSRFFDVCLGWEGLLIEANPRIFPNLVRNRPFAHRYSLAASCSVADEARNATVSFWSSIFTNAAQDNVENRRAYAEKKSPNDISPPKVDVPCGSLTPILLDAFPQGRVHFFSLDVEGAEPGVVANVDFGRVFIDMIMSESSNQFCPADQFCESRSQTRATLQSHGYLLFPDVVERSDLFVHPSSDLVQAFLQKQTVYSRQQIEEARQRATLPDVPTEERALPVSPNSAEREVANTAATSLVTEPRAARWSKYQYQPARNRTISNFNRRDKICGAMPGFQQYWSLDLTLRSRKDEDKTIYSTFFRQMSRESMKTYRYVELGAFDGLQESNTRFFDLCLGWEGLLIEPNPKVYPDLVRNRPHAHRMSFAASCSEEEEAADKTVGFWASAFTNAAQDESANREAYAEKKKLLTQVPCGSLTPVLLNLFPDGVIHFFSLDTEGTEHMVLGNIDFSKITIGVLISENKNHYCLESCESRDKTRALMKSHGYELYSKAVDYSDLFIHPDSEFADLIAEVE